MLVTYHAADDQCCSRQQIQFPLDLQALRLSVCSRFPIPFGILSVEGKIIHPFLDSLCNTPRQFGTTE